MHRTLPHGVAHVSTAGGGAFLPIHTPADHTLLVDTVVRLAQMSGQAQVLVNEHRWMAYVNLDRAQPCVTCHTLADVVCYSAEGTACCVTCAFR